MKISRIGSLILILFILAAVLSACGKEDVAKSRFGQVDATADGKLLIGGGDDTASDDTEEDGATSSGLSKTAKTLDIDNLPPGVKMMVDICDAINMTCVEQYKAYSSDDSDFMWHCVHVYVCNCTDRSMGFIRTGDAVDADPKIVNDIMYAMFGQIRELPQAASAMEQDENGIVHMSISNDLKYRFTVGDRGLSACEVRRVTQYSDSSLEMEVALVDTETGEEVVNFIYTLRANTRDTTTSARFEYEITGVRPADKITSDKMSGIPFLTVIKQVYGYDSYGKDDAKYSEVEEILTFNSFKQHVPGMDQLRSAISNDVLAFSEAEIPDDSWKEIISYPVTTDVSVGVAITVATYPNDSGDPDIHTYNFDKKKNRAMDENDALSLCDDDPAKITEKILKKWEQNPDESILQGPVYRGFIMREDGSADLFYMVQYSDADGNAKNRLVAYNSGSKSVRDAIDGSHLLTDIKTDEMKPPLTHGKKDK
ncbi:MAG: hypothetical protein K6F87_01585 [Lachnospiraceae bacterium]|nr:hypothetical protein [Lachnospiraceae bacterium]